MLAFTFMTFLQLSCILCCLKKISFPEPMCPFDLETTDFKTEGEGFTLYTSEKVTSFSECKGSGVFKGLELHIPMSEVELPVAVPGWQIEQGEDRYWGGRTILNVVWGGNMYILVYIIPNVVAAWQVLDGDYVLPLHNFNFTCERKSLNLTYTKESCPGQTQFWQPIEGVCESSWPGYTAPFLATYTMKISGGTPPIFAWDNMGWFDRRLVKKNGTYLFQALHRNGFFITDYVGNIIVVPPHSPTELNLTF